MSEKNEWKLIESAPKDGTPVLLFARHIDAEASTRVVGWFNADYGWIAQSYIGQPVARLIPSQWAELLPFPGTPASVAPGDAQDELTRDRIEEIAHEVYKVERFTKDDEVWHNMYWLTSFAKAIEKELRRPAPAAGDALDSGAVAALRLALKYWEDRQQRYKNRSPVWVTAARAALAAQVPQQGEA